MAYSLHGSGLQFVVWTLMLVATLRHLQVASRIEADYSYLHALEVHLDEKMSLTFCRERVGYVPEFPLPSTRQGYSVCTRYSSRCSWWLRRLPPSFRAG